VCCAFSFCWYHHSHLPSDQAWLPENSPCQTLEISEQAPEEISGVGKKKERTESRPTASVLASSSSGSTGLVRSLGHAAALLASVVCTAPASPTPAVTGCALSGGPTLPL
jgi:hypothetical protein